MFKPIIVLASVAALAAAPGAAQVRTVDPSAAMQSDIAPVPPSEAGYGTAMSAAPPAAPAPDPAPPPEPSVGTVARPGAASPTYQKGDVLSAAANVFGEGAEDLAKLIEKILKDQGEPNAYIEGREAGGAFALGIRYGSGTMHHKVEGDRPVYWTGPSLGFDVGANGSKSFVLVYNLHDSQELFKRFPAGEGAAYLVGGFTASYIRRGDIVLIPIRLGVGWRLGVNVGYLKFTEKSQLLPF